MKIRAIIVDDEPLARNLLQEYLAAYDQIEVVGEAADGEAAVTLINGEKPDLVFLDVQMPGANGFDVIERLEEIPIVVFSTAYEKYALRAFEVSAVDYLLKPYDRVRFDATVKRCLKAHGSDDLGDKMIRLMEELHKEKTYSKVLFLKTRGRVVPVDTAEIRWVQAQGDYAEIHAASGSYLSGQNLARVEAVLDPKHFVRIHRSSIVNVDFIKELSRTDTGSYTVLLRSGEKLPVGRTRIDLLKDWMV